MKKVMNPPNGDNLIYAQYVTSEDILVVKHETQSVPSGICMSGVDNRVYVYLRPMARRKSNTYSSDYTAESLSKMIELLKPYGYEIYKI